MPNRTTVSWLLIAIFASSLTFVLASNYSNGQASLVRQPIRMKVLRRKEHAALKPSLKEIQDEHPSLKERILEDEIPKHLPIKIKVKKEKEFKDLSNESWARDFELEVTNTGDKPIYFLYILVKTDVKAKGGYGIVFPLYFGRTELGTIGVKALPEDVPIQPGETYGLKIHPGQLEAYEMMTRKEDRPHPKKLRARFQTLSFGDGTGYGPGGIRLPSEWKDRTEIGWCAVPPGSGGPSPGGIQDWLAYDWPSKSFKHSLPASSLPVFF